MAVDLDQSVFPTVAPEPTPNPGIHIPRYVTSAEAFGANIGEAEQRTGSKIDAGIESLMGALGQKIGQRNAESSDLMVTDAGTKFLTQASQLYGDYSTKNQGQAAQSARPAFLGALDTAAADLVKTMPDDASKLKLTNSLNNYKNHYIQSSESYADAQHKNWQNQTYTGAAGVAANQAAFFVNDPAKVDQFLAESDNNILKRSVFGGAQPDDPQTVQAIAENRGANVSTLVNGLIATGRLDQAEAMATKYAPQMDAASNLSLAKALKSTRDTNDNIAVVNQYMGPQASVPTDQNLPAGLRNNNPFNIKYIGQPDSLGPSQNTDQGEPQARYNDIQSGYRAGQALASQKYGEGMTTANAIIAGDKGWTPGNTQAAADVAREMGIKPGEDLRLHDPDRLEAFSRALVHREQGDAGLKYFDAAMGKGASPTAPPDASRLVAQHGGDVNRAVDDALTKLGENRNVNAADLRDYIRTGGHDLDPRTQAYCAAFVGAALQHAGIPGAASNLASDYLNWGRPVAGDVRRGDVLVMARSGVGPGQQGDHVGFATGQKDDFGRIEMVSGNTQGGKVATQYVDRGAVVARRYDPNAPQVATGYRGQAPQSEEDVMSRALSDPRVRDNPTAQREIAALVRGRFAGLKAEQDNVTRLAGEDESRIMATGQETPGLSVERVGAAFGPEAAADFADKRGAQMAYYQAMSPAIGLSEPEIRARVDSLTPADTATNYPYRQKLQAAAEKYADSVIRQRHDDPAGVVGRAPAVQAALAASAKPGSSFAPVIAARLAEQTRLGIPQEGQSPITGDEAKSYADRLQAAVDPLADPKLRQQQLLKITSEINNKYGQYAQQALARISLAGLHVKEETGELIASLMRKTAQPDAVPAKDLVTQTADIQKSRAIDNAALGAGLPPLPPESAWVGETAPPPESAWWGEGAATKQAAPQQRFQEANAAAKEKLIRAPEAGIMDYLDKYGVGSVPPMVWRMLGKKPELSTAKNSAQQ